jgi:hypothetical protein
MSFPPCERRWLIKRWTESYWIELWLPNGEKPLGLYEEVLETITQRPSESKPTVIVETLWFYRHIRSEVWNQVWCSETLRPCRLHIDVEEEYETSSTREVALVTKTKHTLYFVWRVNYGDSSKSKWCKEWVPYWQTPKCGVDETFYKTTTEELR